MSDDLKTAADLAVINDVALKDLEISDLLQNAPLLAALQATYATHGTVHKYAKETGAPVVGFRAANAGREHDSSVDTLVTIDLAILDASNTVDQAIADAYMKGGAEAYIDKENLRHLRQAFFWAEKQLFYGVDNDAAGFIGLADSTAYDDTGDAMVVNAGGSTALSSIWIVHTLPDESAACLVLGNSGQIAIGESIIQRITDGNSKHFPGYFTPITGWLGLQLGSAYDIVRIANVGTDSGKGATDDLIYEGLSKLKSSILNAKQYLRICMNMRSLRQLRESRTATNGTGAPAPFPSEVDGIPIIVTDALSIAETAVTAPGT